MKIRAYNPSDKAAVLELISANTPEFFDPAEEQDLSLYLDTEVEDYFVVEEDNKILGAGGINYFPAERMARISWDMVDPISQGKGIGRKLTKHRIDHLNANSGVDLIVARTTQLVYPFYEKMGFELKKVEKDFWAKNYDLYSMELGTIKELKI